MTDKPNKATRALEKIGKKIDKAFSPKAMKKMKDKLEKARASDPKFQEWKKKREEFNARVDANYNRDEHMAWAKEQDKRWGRDETHPRSFTKAVKPLKESHDENNRHPLERLPKPVRSKLVTQVHPSDRMKVQKILLEDEDGVRKFMAGEIGFRRIT